MADYLFLWKGRDRDGVIRSERISAENAQDAKERLAMAGWTELELVQDEICSSAAFQVERPEEVDECEDEFSTPDKTTEFFEGKAPGIWGYTWMAIKRSIAPIASFTFLLVWGIYTHRTWVWILAVVALAFLILLTPAIHGFFALFSHTSRDYARLNRAKVWGRWNEVLECVEKLRDPDSLTGAAVPEFELTRSRAQALAALGRLEEGVREYSKFENTPNLERWMYLSFLATIYETARNFEKAQEVRTLAVEEKTDSGALFIDLAYGSVRGLNRPTEAREFLAKAEKLEITGVGKAYLPFVRGIICWRERRMEEARGLFEKAIKGFEPWMHNALTEGLILLSQSYLCAVHGALGNVREARVLFGRTEKFLIAKREDEILKACREGLERAGATN